MSPRLRWTAAVTACLGSFPTLVLSVFAVADSLGRAKPKTVDLVVSVLLAGGPLLVVLSSRALVQGRSGAPHLGALALAGLLWVFPTLFAQGFVGTSVMLLALVLLLTSFVLTLIVMRRARP